MHSHIAICCAWSQGNIVDFELTKCRAGNFNRATCPVIYCWSFFDGLRLSLQHLTLASLLLVFLLVSLPNEVFFDWC